MDVSEKRKANFGSWLVSPDGGDVSEAVAYGYLSRINSFQKALEKDFYSCSISEIDYIIKYLKNSSEIKKYRDFLETACAVAMPEEMECIDSSRYMIESMFVALFAESLKTNFPGYTVYRKAQAISCKGFSLLLEHHDENKVLFVVLIPDSTVRKYGLLEGIKEDFNRLRRLIEKEGKSFSVLVVARKFRTKFKSNAAAEIPNIKFMRYSLRGLDLQDEK
ncbi:MAG: hypothetical protein J1D88_06280 [Treponema sp.]|nr:hypothetical protein [Treponema sp.]